MRVLSRAGESSPTLTVLLRSLIRQERSPRYSRSLGMRIADIITKTPYDRYPS